MAGSVFRVASSNAYDVARAAVQSRQAVVADKIERNSQGLRVIRASDDPAAAAQAERARTREARVEQEQRALGFQKSTLEQGESTLGDAATVLDKFRELLVQSGDGGLNPTDRLNIAHQLQSLRDEAILLAKRKDGNGMPLFHGLGSSGNPLLVSADGVQPDPDYSLNGLPGQSGSDDVAISPVLDAHATWFNVPEGNGVFKVGLGQNNQGRAFSDIGVVRDAALMAQQGTNYDITFGLPNGVPQSNNSGTGTVSVDIANSSLLKDSDYIIRFTSPTTIDVTRVTSDGTPFTVTGTYPNFVFDGLTVDMSGAHVQGDEFRLTSPVSGKLAYSVVNNATTPPTPVSGPVTYLPGLSATELNGIDIEMGGISVHVSGDPKYGDKLEIRPVDNTQRPSVFDILDRAIRAMFKPGSTTEGAKSNDANLNHELAIALAQIDTSAERMGAVRAHAGGRLQRAERIDQTQQFRDQMHKDDRSRAEDADMISAMAELKQAQSALDVALRSYSSIQNLSWFDYLR